MDFINYYISYDNKSKVVIFALEPVEDFKPYYTNTFYMYDCTFDKLIKSRIEKYICFSNVLNYDVENRLLYAGVKKEKISYAKMFFY